MAQRKSRKKAPQLSSDTMMIRLTAGLLLIALGILMILSVAIAMRGSVFEGTRRLAYGLAGGLAFLLPIFPIWGGALLIISPPKQFGWRAFLFALAGFLCLLGVMTVFSRTSRGLFLDATLRANTGRYATPNAMGLFFAAGFDTGISHHAAGGALGMIFAWPLWSAIGSIPAGVICMLGLIASGIGAAGLQPAQLLAMANGWAARRRERLDAQAAVDQQQELLWQQQQQELSEKYSRAASAAATRPVTERPHWWQRKPKQQPTEPMPYPADQPIYEPAEAPYPPFEPDTDPYGAADAGYDPAYEPTYVPDAPSYDPANAFEMPQTPVSMQNEALPQRAVRTPYGFAADPNEAYTQRPVELYQEEIVQPEPKPSAPSRILSAWRKKLSAKPDEAAEQASNTVPQPVQAVPSVQHLPQQTAARQPVQQPAPHSAGPQVQHTAVGADGQLNRDAIRRRPVYQMQESELPTGTRRHRTPMRPTLQPEAEPFVAPMSQPEANTAAMPLSELPPWETPVEPVTAVQQSPVPSAPAQPMAMPPQCAAAAAAASPSPWGNATDAALKRAMQPEETPNSIPASQATSLPWVPAVPKLQQERPDGAWTPELKLPPNALPKQEAEQAAPEPERPYVFPSMDLLAPPKAGGMISAEEDALRARRLEETLESFKVPAKVVHITHGPAISRFELEIAAGIRVNRITELDRNIAMNMEVKSVRIEAPIPGKRLVGVEVPNRKVTPVTLREVLETEAMHQLKSPIGVALGKDIAGQPIVCDLARMPHLLIAGATGSGKSVCINTMINSILYRSSPKEVRMILVDPKVVELQCYNNIPHLLIPVVSDPHKAAGALEWAVNEMMERYHKFQEKGVREIKGYNASLAEGEEHMPRILIVIDELADLMMACRKDVEERICRLAQLARAAGMHLIVATQRPSVDVITGLIKANIPSRIAFKVSSNVDSRTILDRQGAEQLLGYGDMLYLPNGGFTPTRVQGCFLEDEEVNRIADAIRANNPSTYDPDVLEQLDSLQGKSEVMAAAEQEESSDSDAALLVQAIEMTVQDGQTSTSMLQRRLRIGYARAGRLIDEMEKRGIVSAKDNAKPRQCLITREAFEQLKQTGALDDM